MAKKLKSVPNTKAYYGIVGLGAVGCVLWLYMHQNFPTRQVVDEHLLRYSQTGLPNKKLVILSKLLKSLSAPKTVDDDMVVEYTVKRMASLYTKTQDDVLLTAIDGTVVGEGALNYICEFYPAVLSKSGILKRYQSGMDAQNGIKRCIGISIPAEWIMK